MGLGAHSCSAETSEIKNSGFLQGDHMLPRILVGSIVSKSKS